MQTSFTALRHYFAGYSPKFLRWLASSVSLLLNINKQEAKHIFGSFAFFNDFCVKKTISVFQHFHWPQWDVTIGKRTSIWHCSIFCNNEWPANLTMNMR